MLTYTVSVAKKRKNPAAVALGRKGGKKGGPARAASMTAEERSESARKAILARWAKQKARQYRIGYDPTLVGLPSEKERAAKIVDGAGEVVRNVVSVIDDLVSSAIDKRTADDFVAVRAVVYPQYFVAMRALGDIARIVIPKQTIDRLSAESFSEMEADFRELGPSAFGTDLTDRGIFTVWMLRRIHDLAQEVLNAPSLPESAPKDGDLGMEFVNLAMWNRFHVDCLIKSMRSNKPIYPGVAEPIRDGLRMAVNAYACTRKWADHRNPLPEPDLSSIEWTREDESWVADSTHDLDHDLI